MTMIATVRCKDGYVLASDSLVTEHGHTFRSGIKFHEYKDCFLGMVGLAQPWPDMLSLSEVDLCAYTEENEHTALLKITGDSCVQLYEAGRCFPILDPISAMGSGAAVAKGALAALGETSGESSCEQLVSEVERILTVACKYAEGCDPPIHTLIVNYTEED